ncbi:MAG TPA: glycosyltransferase [Roseimicrobium sp.]|nr:glycosyltransferase [Roseimicrobium sp.]
MSAPRITILVNGSKDSIEAVRARGLSSRCAAGSVEILYREPDRNATARTWNESLDRRRPDLIYVINTAQPGLGVALSQRFRNRIPYILDTGDAVFEMARASGLAPLWRLPLLWAGEWLGQRMAATVVVRGSRHVEHLKSAGILHVAMISDGCSEAVEPSPQSVEALRLRHGLGDARIVGVLGSLVYSPRLRICYGWDLLNALVRLRDLNVKGLIIGDGPGKDWLTGEAERLGVKDRVVFCGRIPYAEVPAYLRLFDIALSTQTNNLPGQVRTTGKIPEYMAAGRFILASRVGEAERLLPPEMLVDFHGEMDPEYPARLAERIRGVFENLELLTKLGESLKDKARQFCSYPVLAERFNDVVQETMRRGA